MIIDGFGPNVVQLQFYTTRKKIGVRSRDFKKIEKANF